MTRLTALLFSALLFSTPALAQNAAAPAPTPPPAQPFVYAANPLDIVTGNPKAPVTVVEYASLSCPHCAHFYNGTWPALKKKYVDTGKVKFVFRHFPLNEPAMKGAKLVQCVPMEERSKFLKVLFATQDKWAYDGNYDASLANIAGVGGVAREQYAACQADKTIEDALLLVQKDVAAKAWLSSTPTFYIGSVKIEGAQPIEEFSKEIDAQLPAKK